MGARLSGSVTTSCKDLDGMCDNTNWPNSCPYCVSLAEKYLCQIDVSALAGTPYLCGRPRTVDHLHLR
jgi:hypothetical protein